MRRVLVSVSVALLVFGLTGPARSDEAARKIVDKAIQAHGGAEKLAQLKEKSAISKGKMHIHLFDGIDATMEAHAGGKKFKQIIQFSIMGQDITQIVCYDGKEAWIAQNGKVVITLSNEDELKVFKEAIHAEEVAGLVLLGDKKLEISIIGDDKVNDQPVIGVRVSSKDHKDVSLYFDKKTWLLAKIENRSLDFQTKQEVNQERILSDYKDIDGHKHPMKVTVNQDGKKFVEIEFTEVKIVDKLDDNTFDKP